MAGAFHIENFGCRAARADGEAVSDRLRSQGHLVAELPQAEVVLVNTCSVTEEADRQARAFIRRAHRLNPEAQIVVTGCYAQRAPQELAALPGVSAVVGNSHKALVPQIAAERMAGSFQAGIPADGFVPLRALTGAEIWADDLFAHSFLEDAQLVPGEQTRPNLKIQEGCGNRCTFCVIPETRGPSRSLSAESVLAQVRGFVAAGGNELVLSGINLGRWGRERAFSPHRPDAILSAGSADPRTLATLANLVRCILESTDLPRLRLSSIEPMDWDADLIALMREFGGTRLARHAHLPLQSGSDAVLRRMHRRYRPWHYAEKVAKLLDAAGPALTVGADVMAGFPGETDGEFQETCDFIGEMPFGYLHLFPFSPRPNTRGWQLHRESPVPAAVVAERMAQLRRIAEDKSKTHRARFVGRSLPVITLHTPAALRQSGLTLALSENFLPIHLRGENGGELAPNLLLAVEAEGLTPGGEILGSATENGAIAREETAALRSHGESHEDFHNPS